MKIGHIPQAWKDDVIKVLSTHNDAKIQWTFTARSESEGFFDFPFQTYDHLIKTLSTPELCGEHVQGMLDTHETWAFLCPNPIINHKEIYAKIDLKEDHISIMIFSFHIDRSDDEKLRQAINNFLQNKS